MWICPSIKSALDKAEKTDDFWIGNAKLNFSLLMAEKADQLGLKNADIARRIGTSNAYISKVFRGDANLTIDSMVKIARALECKLEISLNDGISANKNVEYFISSFLNANKSTNLKLDRSFNVKQRIEYHLADAA